MEQIFKDNPRLDVAYRTSDGRYFFLENDARNYASTLEDKKVEKVTPKKGEIKETVQEDLQADEKSTEKTDVSDEVEDKETAKEPIAKNNKKTKTQ